uniref:Retrovirus-related Pol polyprotein from transposon TNT 1-94 n=1 Tax=Cajanus cajan TaxID=3821 RepID=A0A151RJM0_CAJCA|nr:Retrovirus-related Pol polyprotein from transposon TNT 1-94 [Cajanus cajan]
MEMNGVWKLVELLVGCKTIGCKWVLKTKRDAKGKIERYKARLVARGYNYREGIECNETFSPNSNKNSFHVVMTLVAHFDLEFHQMDVKKTFLNGDLYEDVYMDIQPSGFEMEGKGERLSIIQCPQNDKEKIEMEKVSYVYVLGSLMYATICIHPNIAFVISILGWYISKLGMSHEFVQLFSRVEQQLKRKSFRKDSTLSYSKNFKKEGPSSKPFPNVKDKEKEKERPSLKASSKDTKTSDIKCFKCLGRGHIASQCPTKKTMILRGRDHYSSLDEATSSTSSDEEEVLESEEETYPCEGDLLMVKRLIGNQSSDLDQSQRENLFHTRCKILDNSCSLIVDSGSSCNCCNTRLVNKLTLTTLPHPKPYKLQWINEEGGILVNQQVNMPIFIGKYKDEVLCDVVPLDASHILLGRPWQFDKKTIHDDDVDIKAQTQEAHDQKAQVHDEEDKDQDPIQILSGPMTRGMLKKTQEALQHKVAHLLETQQSTQHMEEARLITCIACLES